MADDDDVPIEIEPINDEPIDDEPIEIEPIDIDNPDPVETARRRYGKGGSMLAAGMFGLDQALTGKVKPDTVQVQESPSDPVDVDKDGFQLAIDDRTSVESPALERRPPLGVKKKKSRR